MNVLLQSTAILAALLVACALTWRPAAAQVEDTATITVLRGEVAVLRPDGSALQPAPSGSVIRAGDEIRTLTPAGALITFFAGTEIELGSGTILVVERVSRQGDRIDVSLKQVFGMTLHRVQTLTDPLSSYRVDAGGAVAVVRGTEFVLYGPTPEGFVVLVCTADCDGRTTFAGQPVSANTGYFVQVSAGRVTSRVELFRPDLALGPWTSATEGATTAAAVLDDDDDEEDERRRRRRDRRREDREDDVSQVVAGPVPGTPSAGPVPGSPSASPVAGAATETATGLVVGSLALGALISYRRAALGRHDEQGDGDTRP